jgi:hypothetical protein
MKKSILIAIALVALSLVTAAVALAAAPANDTRAGAQQIKLGERVNGTTTDATADQDDTSGCGPSDTPSVWYRLDANQDGRAIAQLQASGDLDVVLDIYQRQRSQFSSIACDASDRKGRASTDFTIKKGRSYLIRVSQQEQSVSGDFSLIVDIGQPAARAPGARLPRKGANGTVQRVFEPSNAWSTTMDEGVTYRVNLSPQSCMRLSIYGPNTSSFDGDSPQRVLGCGGYTLFTPGPHQSGRYSFLIEPASSRRNPQRYHLQVSRAGKDDTTPGIFVRNHRRTRGALNANRVDVLDLYRFDVTQQSITDLVLKTSDANSFDLVLVRATGKRLRCACGGGGDENIHIRTGPGRYFAFVRAHRHSSGSYRLERASKVITHTTLTPQPRVSGPGSSVSMRLHVTPGESGPATILIERLDPVAGWQFIRRFETRVSSGGGGATFRPPSVGRYRAQATFNGTRDASGSRSRVVKFRVEEPLTE